jgi:hypothetical protein
MRFRVLPVAMAMTIAAALAACGPTDIAPSPSPTIAPSESGSPTPSAAPAPAPDATFTPATSCTGMLGALETQLIAEGNVLFSSTDGGGIYFPIESTQDGGDPFSCWYGKDGVDLSSFELASQPVDQAHRVTVLTSYLDQVAAQLYS